MEWNHLSHHVRNAYAHPPVESVGKSKFKSSLPNAAGSSSSSSIVYDVERNLFFAITVVVGAHGGSEDDI